MEKKTKDGLLGRNVKCFVHHTEGQNMGTSHRPLSDKPWEAPAVWMLGGGAGRAISDTLPKNENEIPAVLEVVGLQRLV